MAGAGRQIGIPSPLANFCSSSRRGVCGLVIAGRELLFDLGKHEIAPLDTLAVIRLQQALGPRQPTRRVAGFASKEQSQADPETASGSKPSFAGIQALTIYTFENRKVVIVPPNQVCGRG